MTLPGAARVSRASEGCKDRWEVLGGSLCVCGRGRWRVLGEVSLINVMSLTIHLATASSPHGHR